jgi:hypothetical protein
MVIALSLLPAPWPFPAACHRDGSALGFHIAPPPEALASGQGAGCATDQGQRA